MFKQSPIVYILSIIGKKWTVEILDALLNKEQQFSDIQKLYPEMSGKMLSRRVKELFDVGLIGKTISSIHPLEFKYHISNRGKSIRHLFYELGLTGAKMFRNELLEDPNTDTQIIEKYFNKVYYPSRGE